MPVAFTFVCALCLHQILSSRFLSPFLFVFSYSLFLPVFSSVTSAPLFDLSSFLCCLLCMQHWTSHPHSYFAFIYVFTLSSSLCPSLYCMHYAVFATCCLPCFHLMPLCCFDHSSILVSFLRYPQDEPSSGMDPRTKRHLWKIISEEVKGKCAVVLTSHRLEDIMHPLYDLSTKEKFVQR